MIWLLSNVWWLVPVAIGLLALANLPLTLSLVRRVPVRAWLALAAVALLGLSFQAGRWHERRLHQKATEAAEAKLDRKAADVAKKAHRRAEKVRKAITERTEEAADEVQREMDSVGCDQPLPAGVRDQLDQAVQRAREALPAG